jgi:hypothetical protein
MRSLIASVEAGQRQIAATHAFAANHSFAAAHIRANRREFTAADYSEKLVGFPGRSGGPVKGVGF